MVDDPTTSGCITGATRHALDAVQARFGGYRAGSIIRATGCWSPHPWNPSSDHPKGRGCDFFPGSAGAFAEGNELAAGWELANWFRTHADALQVSYIIWQGRIWTTGGRDTPGGWGRPYTGGGVYDPTDAVGGHFDHLHVSFPGGAVGAAVDANVGAGQGDAVADLGQEAGRVVRRAGGRSSSSASR